MDAIGAARLIRIVLGAGAAVFFVSALALLILPGTFASWLGLEGTASVDWVLRMLGAALLGLSGQMWLVRRADDAGARGGAAVMIVAGGIMTILTLTVPGDWTLLRWAYLIFGVSFVIAYGALIALSVRASRL